MADFLLVALLAGCLLALLTGPLGCFLVWRRMAYFGDTIAHSALLGMMLNLVFQLHPTLGVLASGLLVAAALAWLQRDTRFANDTLLGILAHGSLALGLVALAWVDAPRIDLNGLLFGDILALRAQDLWYIAALVAGGLALLATHWRQLVLISVHEDIAAVEGVPVARMRLMLTTLIAVVVAISIHLVGMLLITALMIIPAATARFYVASPTRMAVLAAMVGVAAVAGGLGLSYAIDTPSGPSIVLAAAMAFLLSFIMQRLRSYASG